MHHWSRCKQYFVLLTCDKQIASLRADTYICRLVKRLSGLELRRLLHLPCTREIHCHSVQNITIHSIRILCIVLISSYIISPYKVLISSYILHNIIVHNIVIHTYYRDTLPSASEISPAERRTTPWGQSIMRRSPERVALVMVWPVIYGKIDHHAAWFLVLYWKRPIRTCKIP